MSDYISTRSISDLLESLERHLKLLRNFYIECFEQNNEEYFGEIAGKIRLLTKTKGGDKALLIGLMKEFEIEPTQIFDGPPVQYPAGHPEPGKPHTLETYLTMDSMGFRTTGDGFKLLSKSEFVCLFAEKHGAAHEDWNHPEILRIIKYSNIFVGDEKLYMSELKSIAHWVLWFGNEFISNLSEELIEEVENKRKLKVNYKDSFAHGRLGTLYLNQGKLKKAKKHLSKSYELDSDQIETHWNLACLYSLLEKYEITLKHITIVKDKWGTDELKSLLSDDDLTNFVNQSAFNEKIELLLRSK
ncbi:tetratricopeptide repeat protein [Photobacterium minamisatsumaniensis]|uniref:tetratricopeptide repeat protein n=1 Tax=Photobacterium minamisatsumaniensis TaxID=2910233 RepID=UPI003D0DBEBB